ncbi:hypothetical protein D918_06428 [Trichuris suis]|nr:hypothetical protein D918_06428 [Trichuris suis]
MDDLIKSILWKKQTLIDGFYAVRQDVYTIRQVETHVRIVFSIVTSVCHPAMPLNNLLAALTRQLINR